MLQINQEKMAKSAGNFLTIKDVLSKYHHEVIRYFLLSSHYRSPLNFSDENIGLAQRSLLRLYQTLKDFSEDTLDLDQSWVNQLKKRCATTLIPQCIICSVQIIA